MIVLVPEYGQELFYLVMKSNLMEQSNTFHKSISFTNSSRTMIMRVPFDI